MTEKPRYGNGNDLIKEDVDLDNLLRNTKIGVLYADNDMIIRKITPIMTQNTNLRMEDIGRSVFDVDFMAGYHTFVEDIKKTIEEKRLLEREITREDKIFLLQIQPYYMNETITSGIIIFILDVTKRMETIKYELHMLMNSIPGGVCKLKYDNGLILEYANEGMFSLLKMSAAEFLESYDNHYERLLLPEDWSILQEKIESLEVGKVLQMEYGVHYAGREEEWRLMQAVILESGSTPVLQCVITNITNIKQTYYQLMQEKEKLNVIAKMSGDMLFEYDIKKDSMKYTRQGEGLLNAKQITGNYVKEIKDSGFVHPDDSDRLKQFCEELQMGKEIIFVELRKRNQDGRYHWIEIEGATIYDAKGRPVKVIGRTKDIDERKTSEEQLRIFSLTDSLTGIFNRQAITEKIKARLKKVEQGHDNWLIIVDIDNFKNINEMNGYLVGDAILCMVADELTNSFKKDLIGRIGGDEFIVFAEKMPVEELERQLIAFHNTVQAAYRDKSLELSCSVGVVRYSEYTNDFNKLFEWADYALFEVKQHNKNNYYILEAKGDVPEPGYLTREKKEDYVREEAPIRNADELVLFTLELLDNVSAIENGLKMVSDRICGFFDIDDVIYITEENNYRKKEYHWSRREKNQKEAEVLPVSKEDWDCISGQFDSKGILVLRKERIKDMPGEQISSILLVHLDKGSDKDGYIAFLDRNLDRDWEQEKEGLIKLAGIISNHLQQLHESERERNEIEFQINYDVITGLPNYQKFIMLAEQFLWENPGQSYYLVYSDFANFQYMNEIYGYTAGDKVLKAFAEQLQKLDGGIYFTRVTSDHFVGLLEGDGIEEVQAAYLEATKDFCEQINKTHEQSNLVSISGVSSTSNGKEALSYAIDRANVARKYGKNTANTVAIIYNKEIKEKSESEKSISANMAAALEHEEFKAWIQPKVSLETGKIVGAEALVRWQRADGSMIYPDSFIPIFEKNGFITKIDFTVLDQVLTYLRDAMDNGEEAVPISVNFSRSHNETPDFVEQILSRLQKKKIPPKYIEAEITESIFMLDLTALTHNLHKLKESGISISIDDFGSGYSSLNVLANVEADVIKLDRKFLSYAGEDSKSPIFVKYLIRMMKRMGYQVLAEGVETKEQLTLLHNAECDMVQGYYYAKPMPIPAFREFLKEFNK